MSNRAPSIVIDFNQMAILLDVDGTLGIFAPTPREVFVSHELRDALNHLFGDSGARAAPSHLSAADQLTNSI